MAPQGLLRHLDWHVHLCWLQGFHDGLTQGAWYPRWIDGANEGQGGPVFLYYAPLAYYLGSGFMAFGVHVATALKLVYLFSLLLCAGGLYAWLRPVAGGTRAVALAAFGLLTPQLTLFAYSYNMPASALAVGVLPWIGWALERNGPLTRRIAVLAAALALLLVSHTLTGFQTLLLLALAGFLALFDVRWRGSALRILLPAALFALAMAAVYLLPLASNGDLIHPQHLIESPQWRITSNLQFGWLFGGAAAGQGAIEFDIANGLALVALALAVWRLAHRRERHPARQWVPWACAALLCFLLMTPAAAWLYARVELLQYLQFGWRWQALFLLCVLRVTAQVLRPASASVDVHSSPDAMPSTPNALPSTSVVAPAKSPSPTSATNPAKDGLLARWLFAIGGVSCAVGIVVCMLRITPPFADGFSQAPAQQRVGLAEAERFAERCAWPMLEYRPRAMGDAWGRELSNLPRSPTTLRGRAHVVSADVGNEEKHYEIVADLPSRIVFPVLAFPGWNVTVGELTDSARAQPDDGRIVLVLPRGRHQVVLQFESPPSMRAGAIVSIIGLVLWVVLFFRWWPILRSGERFSNRSQGTQAS